jgi:hypothetical protein
MATPLETFIAAAAAKAIVLGVEAAWLAIEQALRSDPPQLGDPPPPDREAEVNAEIDRLRAEQDRAREP